ncbi:MAG: phosphotransferase family protein [Dehalococcoidia bacterium]|nr:phosphotransferase family protein [Dehalococcoidia bacterium]
MHVQLTDFLRAQWPDAEEIMIEEFAVLAGGYSQETYRFDARVRRSGREERLPLILRKNPPLEADILPTSREQEHRILCAVKQHTTIPVSTSYCVAHDPAILGTPAMVIERVRGSGQVSDLFNGGPAATQAENVATQLCEKIAELHLADPKKIDPDGALADPRGVGIDVSSWDRYMESTFDYYIRGYDESDFSPLPNVLDTYLAIRRNKPRPLQLSVVHGDFNPANFLYEDGNLTALIDWENCHIGDPREDLGWMKHMDLLSNTNVFGSVKENGGFLGHYNKITGFNVTEEEVEYFRLFGAANIAIPVLGAVKKRVDRKHTELLHLYLMQPILVSAFAWAQMLGYPMPAGGE